MRTLVLFILLVVMPATIKAQEIIVADYIIFPPYQQAEPGLTADFNALLQKQLPSIAFSYSRMTKDRLIALIAQDTALLIPFSQAYWFDYDTPFDVSQTTIREAVHIISHGANPIEVKDIEQDKLMFLGRTGYNYKVIDELVDSEAIKRYSCASNDLCLTMLAAKRGDFVVMAKATYLHYMKQLPELAKTLYISKQALYYDHRAMLGLNIDSASWQKINQFANELPSSAEWQAIKAKYVID